MATFKFISVLILIALVAAFTFQNTDTVTLNFLLIHKEMSLSLMLLAFLFAGMVIGWIFSLLIFRKKESRNDDLKEL
jgi:uncharacterized membrane protein YciS (DUF1049 family)